MRILLAQNSRYFPAHGGGDKSNRLLLEALAARGHRCRAVARISAFGEAEHRAYLAELAAREVECLEQPAAGVVAFARAGVEARVATNTSPRACFLAQAEEFRPDVILASTDDPAQFLLDAVLHWGRARVVYLVRATLALPFGPDSAFPNEAGAARLHAVDRVVGVSRYVADYIRRWARIDAVQVPISLLEPAAREAPPELAGFDNEFVTLVNPCAVKGIAIFLALADAFPDVSFAAVPLWGTNREDRTALSARANIRVLDAVDDIDRLLERTRVLLVPSLWAEARSRIVLEAMLRGVPVIASNVGGLPEAKMGVPYLLPVNPIVKYQARLDEQMVPVAEVPPQDIGPWREALARLLSGRAQYQEISRASRAAALAYARSLSVEPFEQLLEDVLRQPRREAAHNPRAGHSESAADQLSPEKRRLLALRWRKRAPASAWFPGADAAPCPRLFWFPHAGGGAARFAGQGGVLAHVCPVRLPGRESRHREAPFERMAPLVEALAGAIAPYLAQPFAFFGHSMGAAVAFELARLLRRRGRPLPRILIVSAARAPQYRRRHIPPPPPEDGDLIEELRRLQGMPSRAIEDPAPLSAILPALRADAALYRNYVYAEDAPLPCAIRAYGGAQDGNVRPEHLHAWAEQTTASFAVRLFPGGHFYLQPPPPPEFLAALAGDLEVR
ncbi:MAG: glycosyltransferase [Acidobacteriia bacterium]|nr:glycosyltransferase [Terriglobia bacterium]